MAKQVFLKEAVMLKRLKVEYQLKRLVYNQVSGKFQVLWRMKIPLAYTFPYNGAKTTVQKTDAGKCNI